MAIQRMPSWLWPGKGRQAIEPPGLRRTYFAFVEDVSRLTQLEAAEGPDGKPLDDLVWQTGDSPLRFRLAAMRTRDFGKIVDRFDVLDHENVEDSDRRRRREQLRESVADLPIPIMDIYADEGGEAAYWLRGVLRAGSWHFVEVLENEFIESYPPIVIGDPDLGGATLRGSLGFLSQVFPNYLVRLQDIFSLVHIPDAQFGTEEGEFGATPPGGGPDDSRGGKWAAEPIIEDWPEAEHEIPLRYLEGEA